MLYLSMLSDVLSWSLVFVIVCFILNESYFFFFILFLCGYLGFVCFVTLLCCFCFFKKKTASELRISDWSSDVCSSDLEPDVAQRAREARHRIEQQQHALALVAEVLGDGGADPRRAAALERGPVRGGDHDHRPGQAGVAEVVVDEFVDLAAALANLDDEVDVGIAAAREHAQQGALAAARNCEDAHPLAFAGGHRRFR